jgi:ferredoxin
MNISDSSSVHHAGACGGELACATCHLIFEPNMYDTLPPKEPEEDDMLDLAFELTDT